MSLLRVFADSAKVTGAQTPVILSYDVHSPAADLSYAAMPQSSKLGPHSHAQDVAFASDAQCKLVEFISLGPIQRQRDVLDLLPRSNGADDGGRTLFQGLGDKNEVPSKTRYPNRVDIDSCITTKNMGGRVVDCPMSDPFPMMIAGCVDTVWYFQSRIVFYVPLHARNETIHHDSDG